MNSVQSVNWESLLGTKQLRSLVTKWSIGDVSTRTVSDTLANTDNAGEFRRLVRTHGTRYGRRLARKALRYRGVNV